MQGDCCCYFLTASAEHVLVFPWSACSFPGALPLGVEVSPGTELSVSPLFCGTVCRKKGPCQHTRTMWYGAALSFFARPESKSYSFAAGCSYSPAFAWMLTGSPLGGSQGHWAPVIPDPWRLRRSASWLSRTLSLHYAQADIALQSCARCVSWLISISRGGLFSARDPPPFGVRGSSLLLSAAIFGLLVR